MGIFMIISSGDLTAKKSRVLGHVSATSEVQGILGCLDCLWSTSNKACFQVIQIRTFSFLSINDSRS